MVSELIDDILIQKTEVLSEWFSFLPQPLEERKLKTLGELNFAIYSHEAGSHHIPHLHVSTSRCSAVFRIEDGIMQECSGRMSDANIKKASTWILSNQLWLMECWNKKTDSSIKFNLEMYLEREKIVYSLQTGK